MSLSADNTRHGRSRSKSRTRERSRSRSIVEVPSPPTVKSSIPKPQYIEVAGPASPYAVSPMPPQATVVMPPMPGEFPQKHDEITMGGYTDLAPHLRPTAAQQPMYYYPEDPRERNTQRRTSSVTSPTAPQYQYAPPQPQYQTIQPGVPTYATAPTYQYAVPPDTISYTTTPYVPQPTAPIRSASYSKHPSNAQQPQYSANAYPPPPPPPPPPAPPAPTYATNYQAIPPAAKPPPSPGLGPRADRLSVSGGPSGPQAFGLGIKPPGSPRLEPYIGTYQTMPSPIIQVVHGSELDDLPPLSLSSSAPDTFGALTIRPGNKRVKIYDASEDARDIAVALNHKTSDLDPIIDILPALTHDQMMELRDEYKKHCKVAGRGVNIAKHIKLKLGSSPIGKIAYITALGRWESEAYWANFWYQSNSSRRELLIEALMGRSNAEIREIKAAFKDKRYNDSLEKCMDKELKADKFRMAVMMVLDEKRQEEQHVYPVEYRNQDVDAVHRALTSREGGETAILQLVVRRSDAHLREVVRTYERKYGANFPREALKKSNNLVGEILAHILNGAINRPARDALLLHHAISDLSPPPPPSSSSTTSARHSHSADPLRYELLISRLVRIHWEKTHLRKVKEAYEERYGVRLEREIDRVARGDFGDFCLALVAQG